MSYRLNIEAMLGNPARERVGDKSGLWRIVMEDLGTGSIIPRNPPRRILAENLTYEEAIERADKIDRQLENQ